MALVPVGGSNEKLADSSSPMKAGGSFFSDMPVHRFDPCESVKFRWKNVPKAMRVKLFKSDYALNRAEKRTIPWFDDQDQPTISKHEMNRTPGEARVQELMLSIKTEGNAVDMTGVPIMVENGDKKWKALTYNHRCVACYRLFEEFPDDPVVQMIKDLFFSVG